MLVDPVEQYRNKRFHCWRAAHSNILKSDEMMRDIARDKYLQFKFNFEKLDNKIKSKSKSI